MLLRTSTLVLLITSVGLRAQEPNQDPVPATGLLAQNLEHAGREHRYVLFVPPGFDASRPWPLIVFLHGAGECGTDGWKQVSVGLAPAILDDVAAWPFLVLLPQKPDVKDAWEDHDALVMAMLARVRAEYPVDAERVFLTGLSQGGHGTWVLGARHHDVWAAIAPVCGYGDPKAIAADLVAMPIWCFHGEADRAVPIRQSRDLVAALREAGGRATLSTYPGVGHNSWDKAYREESLAKWFLAAAVDPAGATYRVHPERAERVVLRLRDTWFTDVVPPGGGTTTVVVELGPAGLTWRSESTVNSGDPPPVRSGKLAPAAGQARLLAQLRALEAAGSLGLPSPVVARPLDGLLMEGHALDFHLEVEGEAGAWTYERSLPAIAPYDPALAAAERGIRELIAAIDAWE